MNPQDNKLSFGNALLLAFVGSLFFGYDFFTGCVVAVFIYIIFG